MFNWTFYKILGQKLTLLTHEIAYIGHKTKSGKDIMPLSSQNGHDG